MNFDEKVTFLTPKRVSDSESLEILIEPKRPDPGIETLVESLGAGHSSDWGRHVGRPHS